MSLATSLSFHPPSASFPSFLADLPEGFGVYAFRTEAKMLHLSWTRNLRRRIHRLLQPDRPSGARLSEQLHEQSAYLECWLTGSNLETSLHMLALALQYFPDDYRRRLRLRLPWFVSLSTDDFPRLIVTNRALSRHAGALGPFANREGAMRYEESVLQLFQIRRCTEVLHPEPDHPGCIYGEMNLCLRPCQQVVSKEEYASESNRVAHFISAGAAGTLASLAISREKAAADLDFEGAAQIHRNIERITAATDARPDMVAPLDGFNGIALEQGTSTGAFHLRPLVGGFWKDAVSFESVDAANRSASLDGRLRAALENSNSSANWPGEQAEHLAVFSRWFYAHSRTGEWFPFTDKEGLPYRKLARGISRLTSAALQPDP